MFDNDTLTFSGEFCGIFSNFDIANGDAHTILGVAMQQANVSSDTTLKCGNEMVARNYATNYSHVPMMYSCENDIHLDKTGNDCAFVIVNYVPYLKSNFSTTTYNPTIGISTTTDINIYGSFSAGEIMISFLLLLIFIITLLNYLVKSFSAFVTKKRYIEYSNGDVPINNEL